MSLITDVLLDTHALLWFDTSPERLPERALALIRERERRVYVSAITAWELSIKHRLGKLPEAGPLLGAYHATLARYGFTELAFSSVHALKEGELQHLHKDPFDRALASQALTERLPILSKDEELGKFPGVTVLWD